MKEYIEMAVQVLSITIELIAGIIILYASLMGMISYFRSVFNKGNEIFPKIQIRLTLGRSFSIALELLLGADILKTAVAPTWNEIGQLASIAAIRTALNYFLEQELGKSEREAKARL